MLGRDTLRSEWPWKNEKLYDREKPTQMSPLDQHCSCVCSSATPTLSQMLNPSMVLAATIVNSRDANHSYQHTALLDGATEERSYCLCSSTNFPVESKPHITNPQNCDLQRPLHVVHSVERPSGKPPCSPWTESHIQPSGSSVLVVRLAPVSHGA